MSHMFFVFVCVVWGSSFILMKFAAGAFGPVGIACGRVSCGAAALALVWTARRRPWRFERRHAVPLFVVAMLGYAIPFTVQPIVIAESSSAFMGLMVGLVPLITILVSIPMLRVYPSARQVVGVVGGLVFLTYLLLETMKLDVSAWYLLLGLSVPVTYAISNVTIKRYLDGVPAMKFTATALAIAGATLIVPAVTTETVTRGPGFTRAMLAMAALGLVSTGLAYYAFYKLLEWHGPLYAGMVTYLVPVVALACGWLANEKITAGQVVALVGILVMVGLVQIRPRNKPVPPVIVE